MHERDEVERKLKKEAERIREDLNGALVIIIAGGSAEAGPRRTMLSSAMGEGDQRLRDLPGILQTSIQIETLKHFSNLS